MTTIKELRKITGMSQSAFAKQYNIPLSTLRKWEQGESKPAEYVVSLIAGTLPSTEEYTLKVTDRNGRDYYCDMVRNTVCDGKGNVIKVKEPLEGVKKENLRIYLEDLYDAFYQARNRFENDCMYDKRENVIWSRK